MTEQHKGEASEPGGAMKAKLAQIMGLIGTRTHEEVAPALFMSRWMNDVDVSGIPEEVVKETRAHSQAAYTAISMWPPDLETARRELQAAANLLDASRPTRGVDSTG